MKTFFRCSLLCVLFVGALISSGAARAQSGPVGWWKFDEGAGTTAADSSGNGHSATLVGSPAWVAGRIGPGAISFSSTPQSVGASGSGVLANLNLTGLTVSAWIKPTQTSGRIVDKDNSDAGWFFQIAGSNNLAFNSDTFNGSQPSKTGASNSITLNVWQHVAATWDGSTSGANIHLYVNGVELTTNTTVVNGSGTPYDDSGTPFTIGNRPDTTRLFHGSIDDVRVYNRVLTAAQIQVVADGTSPSAPSTLTATASGTQINLSWTASTDNLSVAGYTVERCQGSGCTNFAQVAAPTSAGYSDSNLAAATSYSYRVRAIDGNYNLSNYSNTATAATASGPDTQPPTRPSGLNGTAVSASQINLTWTASTDNVGVTGYKIEYCVAATCTVFNSAGTTTSTSFSHTGLTSAATSYIYRVKAFDAAGNVSYPSVSTTVVTQGTDSQAPTAPTSLTANPAGSASVELSWWAASDNVGVSSYLIERCQGAGCTGFVQVGISSTTAYLDTLLDGGTVYNYRVRASDPAGNKGTYSASASTSTSAAVAGTITYVYDELGRLRVATYGNGSRIQYSLDATGNRTQVASTLDTTAPAAPIGLAGTWVGASTVNLSWTACEDTSGSGVAGYQIFRADHGTAALATSTTTSYSDTSVVLGNSYTYTVACADNATPPNVSPQSSSVVVARQVPTAPVLSATALNGNQVNLTWTAATFGPGATLSGYQVYRGTTVLQSAITGTSFSDMTTVGNSSYTYKVVASDSIGESATSNTVNITTPVVLPSTPTSLTATAVSSSEIDLSWGASTDTGGPGLQGYVVTRTDASNSAVTFNTTTNSYHDTSVASSSTYTYSVYATDTAGVHSATSNTASATTPLATPSVPGTPAPSGRVTKSPWVEAWAASTGPVSYYILNRNNSGTITNYTITAPATNSSQSGTNGQSYTFKVQACNANNVCSAFSAPVVVTLCTVVNQCQ